MKKLDRREFLELGVAAAAAAALPAAPAGPALPVVPLGNKQVTRLIAGGNPIGGYSHSTPRLSQLMVQWFTPERTTEYALRCEQNGINTWQSHYDAKVRDALTAARERGCKIQWICLTADKQENLKEVLGLKPIAVSHHGNVTDDFFRAGEQEKIHDFVKRVHDAGVIAGVSSHNPDNIARIEDAGWENDFYMTCFYRVSRTPEDIKAVTNDRVLGELYLESDPLRMTARIRQVKKTCLAFKILAAGRLCNNKKSIEQAFRFAYSNIKPADACIVGLYPVFSDEIEEDASLARKFAS
jgi:hypothetical protein